VSKAEKGLFVDRFDEFFSIRIWPYFQNK